MATTDPRVFCCPSCHGLNRVPAARVAQGPKCGRCKTALDVSASPVDVDDAELERLIRRSPVPVLADFWAPWCGPCKVVAPQLKTLAARHAGRLIVAKVNTDRFKGMASKLSVQAIPTLVLWREGQVAARQAGALMGPQLEGFVAPHL